MIPDDYDGTDSRGNLICDCCVCLSAIQGTLHGEPQRGRLLFASQVSWHRHGLQHQRRWQREPDLELWYINYSPLRLAEHSYCLKALLGYRRQLRGQS